jgi:toluene monooxygenase system protein B
MALLPLQAAFRGDFVVLLVPVDDSDTMEVVAQKVTYHVFQRRLPPQDAPLRVRFADQVLPPTTTVREVGLQPMDFVEVFYDV